MTKNNPKTIHGWCMYDWANSVYSLVITSTIFPIYFNATAVNEQGGDVVKFLSFHIKNTVLYSYSLSASFLIIALISPFLSGIADYSNKKKAFMRFFCYAGSLSCALLYFFETETLELGVYLFIIAGVGFSGSIVFYNAFLPEIATSDKQDRVSAKGFAYGYIGSVILLLFNLSMMMKPEWYGGVSKAISSKLSFLLVGIWWFVFGTYSLSFLKDLKEKKGKERLKNKIFKGFKELKRVFNEVKGTAYTKKFLLAFFFYSMGVQTVMYIAAIFADEELNMKSGSLISTILIIQLVAIVGAWFFSYSSGKIGNINTLLVIIMIWMGICVGAYSVQTAFQFYFLAGSTGLVMGGVQTLSRSTYSKLIPPTSLDHASYFSFYDVLEKIGIVLGTFSYGLIENMTGNVRNSVITLITYFIIGFIFLYLIKRKV